VEYEERRVRNEKGPFCIIEKVRRIVTGTKVSGETGER
jgi:hypothetical protein